MQRDILIFQNPVIVKGHNIFSLITPKATHVNKARERVKEISEFRQLHDRFKGEVVDGCHAPALGAGGLPCPRWQHHAPRDAIPLVPSLVASVPPTFPQVRSLRGCSHRKEMEQPELRRDRQSKIITAGENTAIGWPDLHRPRGCPKLIPV